MALAKKPITFKNTVNPLTWNVPIVNKDGSPTEEFQRKWLQQATTNASIVNLTTAAGVSAVLDLITALAGSLLVRGTTRWQGLPSPADATMFLNGAAAPAFAKVKDTDLAVTDVTGNNVSIAAHGFAPKAPNDATKYLDGTGAYSVPPSGGTAAASIYDDGTNIYLALVDADEQLVLDGSGLGVYAAEVFPPASLPLASSSAFGAVKVDGFSIQAVAGIIGSLFSGVILTNPSTSSLSVLSTWTKFTGETVTSDTQGAFASHLFTPNKAGKYLCCFTGYVGATNVTFFELAICKNGAPGTGTKIADGFWSGAAAPNSDSISAIGVAIMNGTTDTLELDYYQTSAASCLLGVGSNWNVIYLGA